jgi:hypothetical protein
LLPGVLGLLAAAAAGGASPADAGGDHWSFRPVRRTDPPRVRDAAWCRTPVDAFILDRLERAGLKPNAPADKAALLRRVTFDLTGLPPAPEEVEAFLADTSPDAYTKVVDRLLASPHYGERWAQHWLDVARFAETHGYESDLERPDAWRYRDYVVGSLNNDKPFDRFLTEQVAGDLLAGEAAQKGVEGGGKPEARLLVAAGFNRCGPVHLTSGNLDPEVGRQEVLTEMTVGVGAAFLGLTIGCARCHDHKFDPVSQEDYYRLQAFFGAARPKELDLTTPAEKAAHDARLKEVNDKLAPLVKEVEALDKPHKDRLEAAKRAKLEKRYVDALAVEPNKRTPEQKTLVMQTEALIQVRWNEILDDMTPAERERRAVFRAKIHALKAQTPAPPAKAWTVADDGTPPATNLLKRGNPKRKGERVTPGYPRVLAATAPPDPPKDRRDLAKWLTRPENPLAARVIVNRLWQHHFGRGLVATPNDFGRRGEPPSHPELLDWLATELTGRGWSLKHLHRLMVLSAAYRQDSRGGDPAAATKDPDNRLLWRMNRQRLGGEALRDAALAVSGRLNPAVGGPSVKVPLEPEVYELIFTEGEPDGLWPVTPDADQHRRRSLYLFRKRNVRMPLFEAFDQPDSLTSCPVRPVSTSAPQALVLFNGPAMREAAAAFADRLARDCGKDRAARVERAYRLALARPPCPAERAQALEFLAAQAALPNVGPDPERAALADFCLAMLNRNEFVYVP